MAEFRWFGHNCFRIRAREATPEMLHTIHEVAEDVRRQVKKNRELRRGRERTRRVMGRLRNDPA